MAFNVGDRVVFIRDSTNGGRDFGTLGDKATIVRVGEVGGNAVRITLDPDGAALHSGDGTWFCDVDNIRLLEEAPVYSECWLVIYGDRANPANPFRSMLGSRAGADRKILEVRRAGFHVFAAKKIKIQLEV